MPVVVDTQSLLPPENIPSRPFCFAVAHVQIHACSLPSPPRMHEGPFCCNEIIIVIKYHVPGYFENAGWG